MRKPTAIEVFDVARAFGLAMAGGIACVLAPLFALVGRFDLAGGALAAGFAFCWLFALDVDGRL